MRVHNIMEFLCKMEKPMKTWPSKENADLINQAVNDHVVLNPDRTIATAAKILARDNPELAGALMQIHGRGAKPYEVENDDKT